MNEDPLDNIAGKPLELPAPQSPLISPEWPVTHRTDIVPVLKPGRLAAGALVLGALTETIFYGHNDFALGFSVWIAASVAVLWWVTRQEKTRIRWGNSVPLGIGVLFFAAMITVRANEFVTFLNLCATFVLGALLTRLMAAGDLARIGAGALWGTPFVAFAKHFTGGIPVIRDLQDALPGRAEAKEKVLPVVRGLLIAAPVLAVFIALLAGADAIFEQAVNHVIDWFAPAGILDRIYRGGFALMAAWGASGMLAWAVTRRDPESRVSAKRQSTGGGLGFTEGAILLGSVIAVFTAFIVIQFAYLFGGAGHAMAVHGLNYATYARRGFAELVWVSILTCALLLALNATLRRETTRQTTLFRSGGTLLVALTFCMLASAMKRMAAYEAAWGETELRLYVDAFIGWLGVGLAALAARLWVRPERGPTFAFCALLCASGYIATLDLENVDAIKIEGNMRHAIATKNLGNDGSLFSASNDAIPALVSYLTNPNLPETGRAQIAETLRDRLQTLETSQGHASWQGWNLSNERAYRLLQAHESEFMAPTKH